MPQEVVMARRLAHSVRGEDFSSQRVGRIVRVAEDGVAWVDFPGNPQPGPVAARSLLDAAAAPTATPDALVDQPVLLAFDGADPSLPIVCGIVRTQLQPKPVVPTVALNVDAVRDVLVDGRQLVFNAGQQILLRCGKSSVLLRRDGKVVIRGTQLLSRASGSNKIKGGTIDLN
jgi:hypothetical protein